MKKTVSSDLNIIAPKKDENIQEYDGYKMPTPRPFTEEELAKAKIESQKRIERIKKANNIF